MTAPRQVRKTKLHPQREVDLTGDTLLYQDQELQVTAWIAPEHHPNQVKYALTFTLFNQAIQIHSKHDAQGQRLYWYCDLLEVSQVAETWLLTDLILDVVVYPDYSTRVLDLAEMGEALEENGITPLQAAQALKLAEKVLLWAENKSFPPVLIQNWLSEHPEALTFKL
jgi:uncharacterized protein